MLKITCVIRKKEQLPKAFTELNSLQEDFEELETSNEHFVKHLQHQSDKIANITVWLKTEFDSKKNEGYYRKINKMQLRFYLTW